MWDGIAGFAQTADQITGQVTDTSDAIVVGATVTLTNSQTNIARTAMTNSAGNYTFPAISPGVYNVKAEMPGFKGEVREGVELQGDGLANPLGGPGNNGSFHEPRYPVFCLASLALLVAIAALWFIREPVLDEGTDAARIDGEIMPLSARINGYVQQGQTSSSGRWFVPARCCF